MICIKSTIQYQQSRISIVRPKLYLHFISAHLTVISNKVLSYQLVEAVYANSQPPK